MKNNIFPRTRFEDYVACREMVITNYVSSKKAGMSDEKIFGLIDFVYERFYFDKIFQEDFYRFENLDDLGDFLFESGYFSVYKIKDCISHENEHLKKIDELGCSVKNYYVCLLKYDNTVTFAAGICIDSENVGLDKLMRIAIAPRELSLTDRLFSK